MTRQRLPRLQFGLPFCLSLTVSGVALAQEQSAPPVEAHVEDVVVSAPEANAPNPTSVEAVSQKQETVLQDVPQAATVITQQQIEALQITNLQEAQKLEPSLQFRYGNVRNLTFNIRGFGASSSNATDGVYGGVPIYIDGVYQPRPGQAVFDIPDLNGMQVFKGPQGTSGGQDSTGGTVNITTSLPSFVAQESAEVSYGNYNYVQVKGTATGPIAGTDWAAFRLSVFGTDRDGYIVNVNPAMAGQKYNDWHDEGARGQILLQPINDLSVRLIFDYSHINQACCQNLFNGAVGYYENGQLVSNNFYTRVGRLGYTPLPANALGLYQTDVVGYQQTAQETEGAAAIVNYNFNGFTLNSTSAYRGWDFHPNNRNDAVIAPLLETNTNGHVSPTRSIEEELKISTPKNLPVEATAGVFYFHENLYDEGLTSYGPQAGPYYASPSFYKIDNGALANATYNYLARQTYDNPTTNEVAPYIQDVWHATPSFDVTTGVRYSYYDKDSIYQQWESAAESLAGFTPAQVAQALATRTAFLGPNATFTENTHFGFVSGLATASYKFTPDVLGYATVSQGGRGGGPNLTANLPAGTPLIIKPEYIYNYETGLKGSWFDQRLQANIAAFVMVDRNYITYASSQVSGTTVTYLANAAEALSRGVELDLRAKPIDGLNTFASFTYNPTVFGSYANAACPYELSFMTTPCNLTGKPLPITPKFAMAVGGEYSRHINWFDSFSPKPVVGYAGADWTYQTGFFSNYDDSIYSYIPGYGLLNLHAGARFDDASWDLSVWVHNALDKHYFINLTATSLPGGVISGNVGDPLMVGVTLKAKL
ncbi:MAG TPA: TonB-dependent receptor [Methylocella sp.]|nr:TonB-dependent receptor [Methylocella sp.]